MGTINNLKAIFRPRVATFLIIIVLVWWMGFFVRFYLGSMDFFFLKLVSYIMFLSVPSFFMSPEITAYFFHNTPLLIFSLVANLLSLYIVASIISMLYGQLQDKGKIIFASIGLAFLFLTAVFLVLY